MKKDIEEFLKKRRCGDGGCVFGAEGMCTNGGCRCFHKSRHAEHEIRREARSVVYKLREVLEYLNETR